MARRSNKMQNALEAAMAEVSQDIMLRAIANTPKDMSLGDFIEAMDRTTFAADFRALDLGSFHAALGQTTVSRRRGRPAGKATKRGARKTAPKGGRKKKGFSTRTQAGREALDAAIAEALKSAGAPVRSEVLKAGTGATPNQIRQSLARLMEAKQVAKKGEKRATEYRWKGRK